MTNSLIVLDKARFWCDLTEESRIRRAAALMQASEVIEVSTPEQQEIAVRSQGSLAQLRIDTEKDRVDVKSPVTDLGRAIDKKAADYLEKVKSEELRVSRLISDYVALGKARIRSAEAAHNESLTVLEREREAALAVATSLEDRDAIHEDFAARMRDLGPAPDITRADGQVIKTDWDFEVVNPLLLAQMHPTLVTITPRKMDIKEALNNGHTIAGIVAKRVTKSTFRKGKDA